jgi:hypothetical protein
MTSALGSGSTKKSPPTAAARLARPESREFYGIEPVTWLSPRAWPKKERKGCTSFNICLRATEARHQLNDVTIAILEVEAPAAVPIVGLSVVDRPGALPKGNPISLHPLQDCVELRVVDVKCVILALECVHVVVKKQCQGCVHAHWCEVTAYTLEAQTKKLREQASGGLLIARRNDCVVEGNCHWLPLR